MRFVAALFLCLFILPAAACEGGDDRYPMTCGVHHAASSGFFGNPWFGGFGTAGAAAGADRSGVASLVKRMAVTMGVNMRLALAVARRESGFNPRARGRAGEYGVFQMKCPTARALGFSGACSQLYDAATNIYWGLKHLAAAQARGGSACQIATRHNAGLGQNGCNGYGRAIARLL